jgi:hypothetical protein
MTRPLLSNAPLDALQRAACAYFLHETNPANGLIPDSSQANAPASIAAVGLGLSACPQCSFAAGRWPGDSVSRRSTRI